LAPGDAGAGDDRSGPPGGARGPDRSQGPPVDLDMRYDGPDLDTTAELLGLSPADLVRRHAAAGYRVAFCGFAPGFGYLTGLPAGPLTTVQDLGRPGWAHLGVPPSGALDAGALRLANRLVGNPESAAGLEVTFGGLAVQPSAPVWIALTGAPAALTVDGRPAAL